MAILNMFAKAGACLIAGGGVAGGATAIAKTTNFFGTQQQTGERQYLYDNELDQYVHVSQIQDRPIKGKLALVRGDKEDNFNDGYHLEVDYHSELDEPWEHAEFAVEFDIQGSKYLIDRYLMNFNNNKIWVYADQAPKVLEEIKKDREMIINLLDENTYNELEKKLDEYIKEGKDQKPMNSPKRA
ncbi:hypothetical protein MHLP_02190 [Candidatus Mycoplasma haematolamae str. Purdue]|uniref:Uncharacterized protein n=1 Tax=Mycoplasma haematolamae (strain Purdue) TaxID=1212765 RepID=I7BJI5_MYCHA|nr:hypothetical protein [Candidatus Mycoplasma haematolamae]AFO52018.1 hypothetical protein MHLP_02190 [Candidatus Mycoplasma haematolamae str. Purdue]